MAFENLETSSQDWQSYTPSSDVIAQRRGGAPELTSNNANSYGILLTAQDHHSAVLKSGKTYYYRSSDGAAVEISILEQ